MGSLRITFSAHKFHTFWTNYLFVKYIRLKRFHQFCIFSFFLLFCFIFQYFTVYFSICLGRISSLSRKKQVLLHQAQELFLIIFSLFFLLIFIFLFFGGIFQSQRVGVSPPGTRMRDKDGDKKLA